ncbi:IS66 family transposase [Nostoc sphaeroides CHAB 2801]|uniref:IS66 family transposase n=1 Tax=Nostoc sphaeroides TaxID=446679 RepID=UPI000E521C5B|nr:IS66 family transposase [Nostoc sphaeroides]MCC5626976.1 IS66 family transposase [Nostoc sphaeroides CHAB 2801]MCC5627961.1 IS66 family transposase [Nostoc sphaeroides CHAB 2801]MCC5629065.1 IS66 family transposase [Nostoc sphaeroides CHAB 2801]MCC5630304.1 IS66 family transposase [Nostoc sphaeroides CHAB 2801]MCC5632169.1 IS66 family transposase [Nostoc sphaeroides CHAB 2801]
MEHKRVSHLEQIPPEDWGKTPTSVKKLVEEMAQQIEQQEKKLTEVLTVQEQLLEKINQTSKNSSSPPSSDPPGFSKKPPKQKSSKKRGGQPGHKGNSRDLYPIEECSSVIEHHPQLCTNCGATLSGVDTNPYRHQIVEIPPISPIVIEHRLHQLTCTGCGSSTRAKLPEDVNQSGYGVRVVALVALLSGVYRNSQRMVQSAMQEVFGISISLGTVNRLRLEASNAVATCVDEAKLYIQKANIVGADETSFNQGNIDGFNPQQRKAWLWVAVTPLVTFFEIALTRCTQAAQNLLGDNFGGILNSDRHGAYNWVELERRQLCWAHLRREFIKISERPGVSAQLGTALVKQQEKLFELWHRVRDGTLSHCDFGELVLEIRSSIKATLLEADNYSIGTREKTPLAKTVRTCRQLLKVEPAMWLFVTTQGVEPTNNAAERAIRPAVIWRRTSFGSQTQTGSNFVARMLTVVTTLKSQKRNVLEFMTQAVVATRGGTATPSLLPEATTCSDDSDLLTAA